MSTTAWRAPVRPHATLRAQRGSSLRCVAETQKLTQRIYVGKGKYVVDDVSKYPGREENAAAGGWAGGEKGLKAFVEKSGAQPAPAKGQPRAPRKQLPAAMDVPLGKDFGGAAGGFPGGEVGVATFLSTGRVPRPVRKPSVGLAGYAAVALVGAYAACVTATGDFNPVDWELVVGSGPSGAPAMQAEAGAKRQARPRLRARHATEPARIRCAAGSAGLVPRRGRARTRASRAVSHTLRAAGRPVAAGSRPIRAQNYCPAGGGAGRRRGAGGRSAVCCSLAAHWSA